MIRARGSARVAGAALLAGLVLGASGHAWAQSLSPSEQRGMTFVRTNCSRCHAIAKIGENMTARRVAELKVGNGVVGSYLHTEIGRAHV